MMVWIFWFSVVRGTGQSHNHLLRVIASKNNWKKDFEEGQCGNDLGCEVGGLFVLLQRTVVGMTVRNCSVPPHVVGDITGQRDLGGNGTLPLICVWSESSCQENSPEGVCTGFLMVSASLIVVSPSFLKASVWGRGDRGTGQSLPWQLTCPCFLGPFIFCPEKGVREEFSSESRRGESVWRSTWPRNR